MNEEASRCARRIAKRAAESRRTRRCPSRLGAQAPGGCRQRAPTLEGSLNSSHRSREHSADLARLEVAELLPHELTIQLVISTV